MNFILLCTYKNRLQDRLPKPYYNFEDCIALNITLSDCLSYITSFSRHQQEEVELEETSRDANPIIIIFSLLLNLNKLYFSI